MKQGRHIAIVARSMTGLEIERQALALGHRVTMIPRIERDGSDIVPEDATDLIVTAQSREAENVLTDDMYFANVDIYRRALVDAMRKKVDRVCVFSTGSVYGNHHRGPISEDQPLTLEGLSPYALSKVAMEAVALAHAPAFRRLVIVRPFALYGRGIQLPRLLARIPIMLRNGEAFTLNDNKGIVQSIVHISDAARFTLGLLDGVGADIFNVASDEVLTLRDLVERMAEVMGLEPKFNVSDGEAIYLCGSTEKAKRAGFEQRICFRDGLRDLLPPEPGVG